MTQALKNYLRWIGPNSPMGMASAPLAVAHIFLGFAIAAPPIYWALKSVLYPWWKFWLS